MKILTAKQMQKIDRLTSERYGIRSLALMEHAGARVVQFLNDRFSPLNEQQIAVLCGRGNNGGDGLVAARLLRERDLKPHILLFCDPSHLKGDAAASYERLTLSGPAPDLVQDAEAWSRIKPELGKTSLFLDALLGTGLSKPLEDFLLEVVRDMNSGFPGAVKVAVDMPSGLSADSGELMGECVHADASVTFTAPKYAHVFPPACQEAGDWTVADIGTPPEALDEDPELFLRLIQREELAWLKTRRTLDSHKGLYGHVLVLAGSFGKTGAAAMAAKSALRSGAGLVTIATPKSALPIVAGLGVEWMTEPLPETAAGTVSLAALDEAHLDHIMQGKSVLALGPGIGNLQETAEMVRRLVRRTSIPLVLDADGLNAFAGHSEELNTKGQDQIRVLTPHPGEMSRLSGMPTADIQKNRIQIAREFAMRNHLHLVLKGARTLVASPDGRVAVNPTGNPGMATGGTGDCLTGIIAGLLAQYSQRSPAEVIEAAVYLHGMAGDLARRKRGEHSMLAGDLLESLPEAFLSL